MKNEKITFVQIYSNSLFFVYARWSSLILFLFEVLSWQFMQAIYAGLVNEHCLQTHTKSDLKLYIYLINIFTDRAWPLRFYRSINVRLESSSRFGKISFFF